eukprot:TRINITY_DN16271_c0_g1_i1.p1 TRINITY_DN16271_c0_g1~~TRINITY_DN16271_c0_g1_i1.p1  ORF type:complete len:212 (-),score=40.02 TRINITY_DN16271_c0_g1_i1:50-685(-)
MCIRDRLQGESGTARGNKKIVEVKEKLEQSNKRIVDLESELDRVCKENYKLSQQIQYLEFKLQKICYNRNQLPKDLETELEKREGTALQAYYEGRVMVLSELVIHWKEQSQILYDKFSGILAQLKEDHSCYKVDTEQELKRLKEEYDHDLSTSRKKLRSETQKFLSLIHISEPTRPLYISYAVFCLKKKKKLLIQQQDGSNTLQTSAHFHP